MPGKRPRPIYKFDSEGQRVERFNNIYAAAASCGLQPLSMYKVLRKFTLHEGFRYSFDQNPVWDFEPEPVKKAAPPPWEKNGYFDVDGWGSLFPQNY